MHAQAPGHWWPSQGNQGVPSMDRANPVSLLSHTARGARLLYACAGARAFMTAPRLRRRTLPRFASEYFSARRSAPATCPPSRQGIVTAQVNQCVPNKDRANPLSRRSHAERGVRLLVAREGARALRPRQGCRGVQYPGSRQSDAARREVRLLHARPGAWAFLTAPGQSRNALIGPS